VRSQGGKPQEVLDLHDLSATVFEALQVEFSVPERYPIALHDVDHLAANVGMVDLAAYAMHHLQLVRRYAAPEAGLDPQHFVGVLVLVVRTLDELTEHAESHRGILTLARDRLYDAAWAIVRDTGGPGLFDPR
jgi:hypothetical protein